MSKILFIDTSNNKKIIVSLSLNGKKHSLSSDLTNLKSEATLPLINKLLKNNKVKIEDINEIRVKKGPGSFTGLRVGISISNALSYLLKIPINNKKIGELENPVYN